MHRDPAAADWAPLRHVLFIVIGLLAPPTAAFLGLRTFGVLLGLGDLGNGLALPAIVLMRWLQIRFLPMDVA